MTEFPTFIVHTGDGVTTDFAFPFAYIDAKHINVTVNGVTVPFSLIGQNIIRLEAAPANGAVVRISRQTPGDPLTTWRDGAVILGKDLNLAARQPAYVAQEARDIALEAESIASSAVTDAQNHANAAAQSAASAANSASNAIQIWSDFQKRYLGAKSSPPTVDNEGKPLTNGVLYFNTTTNQMFVFRSGQWVLAYAAFEEHDHDQRYYTKSQIDDIVQDINDDISALDQVKQDDLELTGKATGDDFRAGTDDDKALTTKAAYDASDEVTLTYANPLVIDFSQGTNFKIILEGSPEIQATGLDNVDGKMGRIRFIQDENGAHEPTWDSDFVFARGEPPTFSTDPGTEDRAYYDICDGKVYIAFVEDVK